MSVSSSSSFDVRVAAATAAAASAAAVNTTPMAPNPHPHQPANPRKRKHATPSTPAGTPLTQHDAVTYDETALSLFRRIQTTPVTTGVAALDALLEGQSAMSSPGLQPGQVLELYAASQAGKTEVCYSAVLQAAFPRTFRDVPLGGEEQTVVFVDLDFRYNNFRLNDLLHYRLQLLLQAHVADAHADLDAEAQTAKFKELYEELSLAVEEDVLERIVVISCETHLQFLSALLHVRSIAASVATTGSPMRLLVIDNIASFFWRHRSAGTLDSYSRVVRQLQALLDDHRLSLIVTKPILFRDYAKRAAQSLEHVELLTKEWTRFVDFRAVMHNDGTTRRALVSFHRTQCGWFEFAVSDGGVTTE